jgi:hypothetical protein
MHDFKLWQALHSLQWLKLHARMRASIAVDLAQAAS